MKTDKFGFIYKDYDIFKQYCKNNIGIEFKRKAENIFK